MPVKDAKSAYSLSFLRPILHRIKDDDIIVLRVVYSRQGGNRDVFAVETAGTLLNLLRKLPPQTAVTWWAVKEPKNEVRNWAYIPTNGEVITGAY